MPEIKLEHITRIFFLPIMLFIGKNQQIADCVYVVWLCFYHLAYQIRRFIRFLIHIIRQRQVVFGIRKLRRLLKDALQYHCGLLKPTTVQQLFAKLCLLGSFL